MIEDTSKGSTEIDISATTNISSAYAKNMESIRDLFTSIEDRDYRALA